MKGSVVLLSLFLLGTVVNAEIEEKIPEFNVLVTGFGPFRDVVDNPSGQVAKLLDGICTISQVGGKHHNLVKVCFEGHVLNVTHDGASTVASLLERSNRRVPVWDAVIHMGFESVARGLKLETVGANLLAESAPAGQDPLPIFQKSPPVLPTTVDLSRLDLHDLLEDCRREDLCQSLRKHVASQLETWSRDAGNYYCNETLYRTLRAIRHGRIRDRADRLLSAMFVHVPPVEAVSVSAAAHLVSILAAHVVSPIVQHSK